MDKLFSSFNVVCLSGFNSPFHFYARFVPKLQRLSPRQRRRQPNKKSVPDRNTLVRAISLLTQNGTHLTQSEFVHLSIQGAA